MFHFENSTFHSTYVKLGEGGRNVLVRFQVHPRPNLRYTFVAGPLSGLQHLTHFHGPVLGTIL